MPSQPPPGFITRPTAAKIYNRSQRQLERDVHDAYRLNNDEVLQHYVVITKDGLQIPALETSIEDVRSRVRSGQVPVWHVEERYLEEEFGRKGEPKPQQTTDRPPVDVEASSSPDALNPTSSSSEEGSRQYLSDDIQFLRERIHTLEREKREEAERNEKREAKLFAQLEVKDKQISAWDEVTQGLTKGLATGQLTLAAPTVPVPTPKTTATKETKPDVLEIVPQKTKATSATKSKRKNKVKKHSRRKTTRKASKKWFQKDIRELFTGT